VFVGKARKVKSRVRGVEFQFGVVSFVDRGLEGLVGGGGVGASASGLLGVGFGVFGVLGIFGIFGVLVRPDGGDLRLGFGFGGSFLGLLQEFVDGLVSSVFHIEAFEGGEVRGVQLVLELRSEGRLYVLHIRPLKASKPRVALNLMHIFPQPLFRCTN